MLIDFDIWEWVSRELRGFAIRLANDWELPDELFSRTVLRRCGGRAADDAALDLPVEDPLADDRPVVEGG